MAARALPIPKEDWPPMTEDPCPRCLHLAMEGHIRMETVQCLPVGACAPLAIYNDEDRYRGKQCLDCQSADNILKTILSVPGFIAARIAVGNDRQEQYRLPGVRMGLVQTGHVRPSKHGDLTNQVAWLNKNNWFELEEVDDPQG